MSRNYEKKSIEEFGRHLLQSGDLDPVYLALNRSGLDRNTKARWLIAYWCFYHCGTASHIAQYMGEDFWSAMMIAAVNDTATPVGGRWERGKERRHFRGQQGIKAVEELMHIYREKPENMVWDIVAEAQKSMGNYKQVSDFVKKHRGFGDWISFKVCDMVDAVMGIKIDFTNAAVFMFKDPVEAAFMLWRQKLQLPATAIPKERDATLNEIVGALMSEFADFEAPHAERSLGVQEIETILCKWKSHQRGHYPYFNDIIEIGEGVKPWVGVCDIARIFYEGMPKHGA